MKKILLVAALMMMGVAGAQAQVKKGTTVRKAPQTKVVTKKDGAQSVTPKKEEVKVDFALTDKWVSPKVAEDGTFSCVVGCSTGKDKTYQLIKEFLATTDKTYSRAKQLEDAESGKLIFLTMTDFITGYADPMYEGVAFSLKGFVSSTITIDCKDGRYRVKNADPKCSYTKKIVAANDSEVLGREIGEAWNMTSGIVGGGKLASSYETSLMQWLTAMRNYVEKQKEDDF